MRSADQLAAAVVVPTRCGEPRVLVQNSQSDVTPQRARTYLAAAKSGKVREAARGNRQLRGRASLAPSKLLSQPRGPARAVEQVCNFGHCLFLGMVTLLKVWLKYEKNAHRASPFRSCGFEWTAMAVPCEVSWRATGGRCRLGLAREHRGYIAPVQRVVSTNRPYRKVLPAEAFEIARRAACSVAVRWPHWRPQG